MKKQDTKSYQDDKKGADRGKRVAYTHFLSIPIKDNQLRKNIDSLKKEIIEMDVKGITKNSFTKPSDHHLTLLMLDLSDPVNFEKAKSVLKASEIYIQEKILGGEKGMDPTPINVDFRGVKTFGNPQQARILYNDVHHNNSFDLLVKISDYLIRGFIEKGLVEESDLSHVRQIQGLYQPEFHLTLLRAGNRTIDASKILTVFHSKKLGEVKISQIHLSSRDDFEDSTQRMKRSLWNSLKDHEASYACEQRIYLNYDELMF